MRDIQTRAALALVALLAVAAGPAQAQRDTTEVIALEPVKVTAATPFDRVAATSATFATSVRRRPAADLNNRPALSLGAITRTIPGLSVNSREHYALGNRVTMRGLGWRAQFGIRGVQILLDGIPLTIAGGQAFTYVVDPSFVRRVEVIRGPASVFWGNAAGGVLSFSTRPPEEGAPLVRARQVAGSYGLSKTDLQVTPDLGSQHELSAYGSYLSQSGYRAHSTTRLGRLGATGDVSLGEDRGLRFAAAYVSLPQADSPGSLPRDLVSENPQQARDAFVEAGAGKMQKQGQLGLTYYDDLGAWGRLKTTAYGLFRNLENPLPFAYITFDRLVGGTRLTLEGRVASGVASGLEWGVGLEGKFQRDDRIEYENAGGEPGDDVQTDQLETVANQGVFGRATLPLGERARLSAGARYDHLRFAVNDRLPGDDDGERTFQSVSPSVGVSYRLDAARLFAHFSTALEAPTTTELGNRPDAQGGFNPEVRPERVLGLEIGAQGAARVPGGGLSYDAALFGMQVRDFLVPYQNDSDETFYRNAGRTRHAGLEAAVQWQLPQDLSLAASYTYLRAEFVEARASGGASLDGNRVPGVPRHLLGGTLRWRPAPVWLALEGERTSAYPVDNSNTAEIDGYAVLGARVSHPGYEWRGLSVQPFAAVKNLLDARYVGSVVPNAFGGRYFEPAAGRHWQAGVSVQVK